MSSLVQSGRKRSVRWVGRGLLALLAVYALLLIPESQPPPPRGAGKEVFRWNRDAFWKELEARLREARSLNEGERRERFNTALAQVRRAVDLAAETNLPPGAAAFDAIEAVFFELAPIAAVNPERLPEVLSVANRMRQIVKWQSREWPVNSPAARQRLYRLLYGSRAAVEEVLLQMPSVTNSLELMLCEQQSLQQPPAVEVLGVKLHSGDILVSRGGAPTSALIARGNDYPGNFSHIALVHVDAESQRVSVIESHIESGVGVRPIEQYLGETKLRIMVLRLRSDLPALVRDPLLPQRAAALAVSNALARHIPYDFAMDHTDPSKQFCSEVATAAYEPFGVKLWLYLSQLSTPGVTSWLGALGVRNFESQEPSDLEYDPQVEVVAEWRDPATLFRDHVDNAVTDVMLEGAEHGEKLDYNVWMLPFARLAKAWSVLLNCLGKVGPVPEGMSAATALRVGRFNLKHTMLQVQVMEGAEKFRTEHGYAPPYWELVRLAQEAHAASAR